MTDIKNIPLAGHGIDRLVLSEVARILWCDVVWDDEREAEYRQQSGCQFNPEVTARPETPSIPDLDDALFKLFHIVGRIEQSWGRSFWDVAGKMYPVELEKAVGDYLQGAFNEKLETLVYRTIMACIGNGVGPDDDGDFPEDLDAAPILIENPLLFQLELLQ